jgi:hypothetical protein
MVGKRTETISVIRTEIISVIPINMWPQTQGNHVTIKYHHDRGGKCATMKMSAHRLRSLLLAMKWLVWNLAKIWTPTSKTYVLIICSHLIMEDNRQHPQYVSKHAEGVKISLRKNFLCNTSCRISDKSNVL